MIDMKSKVAVGALLAGIAFLGSATITNAAFGVSPPFFNADHLVAGVTYSQTIYLVQDQPTADLPIKVTMSLPAHVQSWITLDHGLNFVIPQGVKQFPVTITAQVPQGEGLGKYSGNIVFASSPSPTGQVTIALGANVAVNLTIGNGVYEQYSIPTVSFPSIEEGWNPKVYFLFQNNGNIAEQLDSVVFNLYDQYDTVRLAYMTQQSGFSPVPPFTSKDFTVEFPTDFHMGVGDYWATATFYKNYQQITTYKGILHVLPPGSLSSPLQVFLTSLKNYWFLVVLGLVIILLIAYRIWVVVARRRKRAA